MRIRLRRGTAAQWAAANPVLQAGEPAIATDTGQLFVGDGVTVFSALTAVLAGQVAQDPISVGESTIGRNFLISGTQSIGNGWIRLSYFTAQKTETSSQVRIYSGSTAAGATPTMCKLAIFEVDAAGDGTLAAVTANDTSLFASANTGYTRSWVAPFDKVAGKRYAAGPLVITSYATPSFQGLGIWSPAEASVEPRNTGYLSGLSDAPATFTAASVSASSARLYLAILP